MYTSNFGLKDDQLMTIINQQCEKVAGMQYRRVPSQKDGKKRDNCITRPSQHTFLQHPTHKL